MTYAKIRMPESETADDALLAIMRTHRLVGVREQGEVLYQVPSEALATLDEMGADYDLLQADLAEPERPAPTGASAGP